VKKRGRHFHLDLFFPAAKPMNRDVDAAVAGQTGRAKRPRSATTERNARRSALEKMRVAELKHILSGLELRRDGVKAALVERILAVEHAAPAEHSTPASATSVVASSDTDDDKRGGGLASKKKPRKNEE
jgi:hypothetical protein